MIKQDEIKEMLRKQREDYLNRIYEADMKEYADGAVYTALERARIEMGLEEEDDDTS